MGRLYKPTRKLKNGKKWKSNKWYIEYQDANGKQVRIKLLPYRNGMVKS